MLTPQIKSGFVTTANAKIYYKTAGKGIPLVMIHAGVADSRQWNNEFTNFAQSYQVIRYDMRGHGKSEPVDGEFSHLSDLVSLLDDNSRRYGKDDLRRLNHCAGFSRTRCRRDRWLRRD